jgi:alkylation response protein AidB-like acyl-CoA dehydrogenase
MSQFDLTDGQRRIRETARAFTADAITPHAAAWDEKHVFPRDTVRAAAAVAFGKRS